MLGDFVSGEDARNMKQIYFWRQRKKFSNFQKNIFVKNSVNNPLFLYQKKSDKTLYLLIHRDFHSIRIINIYGES